MRPDGFGGVGAGDGDGDQGRENGGGESTHRALLQGAARTPLIRR